jgi:hypothetical protein
MGNWQIDRETSYVPLYYKGEIVGVVDAQYVDQLGTALNDDENVRKALRKACYDLISLQGGTESEIEPLMDRYLSKTKIPKQGVAALAFMLKDRQKALDLNNQQFLKFCDSYKLSRQDIQNILKGKNIDDELLTPITRILGISYDEVLSVRYGVQPSELEEGE